MEKREQIIRLWFDMWLTKTDMGIEKIFAKDCIYIESWGPEYKGQHKIKYWFEEWNNRGSVLEWNIKQYFHNKNQTAAEWHFQCAMDGQKAQGFDGVTVITWTEDNKIQFLKEYGSRLPHYDPYENLSSLSLIGCNRKTGFETERDLFFSESHTAHLRRGLEALNAGKGREHELIEVDGE